MACWACEFFGYPSALMPKSAGSLGNITETKAPAIHTPIAEIQNIYGALLV